MYDTSRDSVAAAVLRWGRCLVYTCSQDRSRPNCLCSQLEHFILFYVRWATFDTVQAISHKSSKDVLSHWDSAWLAISSRGRAQDSGCQIFCYYPCANPLPQSAVISARRDLASLDCSRRSCLFEAVRSCIPIYEQLSAFLGIRYNLKSQLQPNSMSFLMIE